MEGPVSYTG